MKALLFYFCVFSCLALFESCLGTPPAEEYTQLTSEAYQEEIPKGTLMYDFSDNETFDSFIEKFSLDSLFQESRVIFPLNKTTLDENLQEVKQLVKPQEYWRIVLESSDQHSMRYYQKKKKNLGIVEMKNIENESVIEYIFELKDGEWFLIEIKDLSI